MCLGGDIAHNHDRWEVASHMRDMVDTRRRLGGLPGRGEERLGAKPVILAPHQSRRDLHPGPGAGKTYSLLSDRDRGSSNMKVIRQSLDVLKSHVMSMSPNANLCLLLKRHFFFLAHKVTTVQYA